ncbi:hypothetical protein Tco_0671701 [Tanacetum coccineum]
MEVVVDQCFVDKRLFEIEKKELKLENECLLEHIIRQDVVNIVMHADVKSDNELPVQNTFLDDNISLDVLKMENDHLIELLLSQDLVHTAVNSLAAINDYKSMERSYIEEYERNLKLTAKISQMNELSKTCSRLEQWEKSSYLRAVLSTTSISSHARSVNKWINCAPILKWSYGHMTSEQHGSGLGLHQLTPGYISSGLYFNPPPRAVSPNLLVVAAPRAVDPAGSPLSSTIDQDVPSANSSSEETTLQGVISSNLHHLNQSLDALTKLTKNHSLENVISDPSQPVLTRIQLQGHAIWCNFDAKDNPIPFSRKLSG